MTSSYKTASGNLAFNPDYLNQIFNLLYGYKTASGNLAFNPGAWNVSVKYNDVQKSYKTASGNLAFNLLQKRTKKFSAYALQNRKR